MMQYNQFQIQKLKNCKDAGAMGARMVIIKRFSIKKKIKKKWFIIQLHTQKSLLRSIAIWP